VLFFPFGFSLISDRAVAQQNDDSTRQDARAPSGLSHRSTAIVRLLPEAPQEGE
jgi:hypothetical protein